MTFIWVMRLAILALAFVLRTTGWVGFVVSKEDTLGVSMMGI